MPNFVFFCCLSASFQRSPLSDTKKKWKWKVIETNELQLDRANFISLPPERKGNSIYSWIGDFQIKRLNRKRWSTAPTSKIVPASSRCLQDMD